MKCQTVALRIHRCLLPCDSMIWNWFFYSLVELVEQWNNHRFCHLMERTTLLVSPALKVDRRKRKEIQCKFSSPSHIHCSFFIRLSWQSMGTCQSKKFSHSLKHARATFNWLDIGRYAWHSSHREEINSLISIDETMIDDQDRDN